MTIDASVPGYRRLLDLQQRIHAFTIATAEEDAVDITDPCAALWSNLNQFLTLAPLHGGVHVEFHGEVFDEPLAWTLACLAEQNVADIVVSLSFTGPDEGANGTRIWEFTSLLDSSVHFPRLRSLSIKPTESADHNISLVQRNGTIMEEAGEIARFVAKTPHLTQLVMPNAPDATFFDVPLPHLRMLRIGDSSDTQHFIDALAGSSNLPALGLLDFSESSELQFTWSESRPEGSITPFAAYRKLFASCAFDPIHTYVLRNSCLDLEQLQTLQAMRPNVGFMVIQATHGGYVSHFAKDVFPWKHLVQADPGQR